MSNKKRILAGLCRLELGAENMDFRSTLSFLANTVLGMELLEANGFADANLKRYWNWLLQEIDDHKRRGLIAFFDPLASNTYAFSCACQALLTSERSEEQALGRLALSRPHLLRRIDSLTDREYEALACVACKAIDAKHYLLTPPGNEGGIDFIATLSINTRSHVFSAAGSEIRLVGQCKKYSDPVSIDRLEQFLHTMQNVRHRSDRVRNHIPSWFDEAKGPIVGWIISHSGFQTGTADEAKKHGIVLSDSLDIAELLGLSVNFLSNAQPVDRSQHLLDECRALL